MARTYDPTRPRVLRGPQAEPVEDDPHRELSLEEIRQALGRDDSEE